MQSRQKHIHIEKIKLLYKHSMPPIILSAVASFFLIEALWSTANHQHLIVWLVATNLLALIRILLILKFRQNNPQEEQVFAWEMPYSITLFIVFLTWSIGLLLVMPRASLSSVFIVNTFMIGLAGAAISWYSAIRYLQIGTICIALIPMILVLITLGKPEAFWVGIAASCMLVSCISTSFLVQKNLNGNLELAYDLEHAKKNAELIAHTDMLTGLNNRRAFFDSASSLLAYCKDARLPVSMIMFDIDHFKKINDAFGHASGDVALKHVASLLLTKLRVCDISCRFGGEEFAVLLPNTNLQEATVAAEKLRALVAATPPTLATGESISLSASFGVTDIGDTLDELLSHADEVMYDAKNKGRNLVGIYLAQAQSKISIEKTSKLKTNKKTKLREAI